MRRGLSLRVRLLLLGVVAVAVTTVVVGVVLYGASSFAAGNALRRDARATADQVAELVRTGRLPRPIPVAGSQVVQVLDGQDRVVSATAAGDQLTALVTPDQLRRALRGPIRIDGARMTEQSPYLVVAERVAGRDRVVVVAVSTDELGRTARILRITLFAVLPVLLLVLAAISWRLIGATLRPVERLRAGAERISGAGDDERLPVPDSADEIHALALTLNSMLDRLAASRERQRAFLADVAHELRSPLTSMRTQLEVAQRLDERLGESGDLDQGLLEDVIRMSALVEDLLVMARLDSDAVPLPPARAVDVGEVLDRLRIRYADATVETEPGLVVELGDGELDRLLTNLLDNAVRHAQTQVDVRARRVGDRVHVVVSDDGPGVPTEQRARMQERFTRLDPARDRDSGGTGLGLAIVATLLERRGGRLLLADAPGGGLAATLDLPAGPGFPM